jgi:hypothetical protein
MSGERSWNWCHSQPPGTARNRLTQIVKLHSRKSRPFLTEKPIFCSSLKRPSFCSFWGAKKRPPRCGSHHRRLLFTKVFVFFHKCSVSNRGTLSHEAGGWGSFWGSPSWRWSCCRRVLSKCSV